MKLFTFLKNWKLTKKILTSLFKKKHSKINIEEHEINKFLTILNSLIESNDKTLQEVENNTKDVENGFQDIIVLVISTFSQLLHKNNDSFDLPTKIKNGLVKLQKFLA